MNKTVKWNKKANQNKQKEKEKKNSKAKPYQNKTNQTKIAMQNKKVKWNKTKT